MKTIRAIVACMVVLAFVFLIFAAPAFAQSDPEEEGPQPVQGMTQGVMMMQRGQVVNPSGPGPVMNSPALQPQTVLQRTPGGVGTNPIPLPMPATPPGQMRMKAISDTLPGKSPAQMPSRMNTITLTTPAALPKGPGGVGALPIPNPRPATDLGGGISATPISIPKPPKGGPGTAESLPVPVPGPSMGPGGVEPPPPGPPSQGPVSWDPTDKSSMVGQKALDPGIGGKTALDPGIGGKTALDPGIGGKTALDPGIGGRTALDPGIGGQPLAKPLPGVGK